MKQSTKATAAQIGCDPDEDFTSSIKKIRIASVRISAPVENDSQLVDNFFERTKSGQITSPLTPQTSNLKQAPGLKNQLSVNLQTIAEKKDAQTKRSIQEAMKRAQTIKSRRGAVARKSIHAAQRRVSKAAVKKSKKPVEQEAERKRFTLRHNIEEEGEIYCPTFTIPPMNFVSKATSDTEEFDSPQQLETINSAKNLWKKICDTIYVQDVETRQPLRQMMVKQKHEDQIFEKIFQNFSRGKPIDKERKLLARLNENMKFKGGPDDKKYYKRVMQISQAQAKLQYSNRMSIDGGKQNLLSMLRDEMSKKDTLMQAKTEEQKKRMATIAQLVEEPKPRANEKLDAYLKRVMENDKAEEQRRKKMLISTQSRKESTVSAYAQEMIKQTSLKRQATIMQGPTVMVQQQATLTRDLRFDTTIRVPSKIADRSSPQTSYSEYEKTPTSLVRDKLFLNEPQKERAAMSPKVCAQPPFQRSNRTMLSERDNISISNSNSTKSLKTDSMRESSHKSQKKEKDQPLYKHEKESEIEESFESSDSELSLDVRSPLKKTKKKRLARPSLGSRVAHMMSLYDKSMMATAIQIVRENKEASPRKRRMLKQRKREQFLDSDASHSLSHSSEQRSDSVSDDSSQKSIKLKRTRHAPALKKVLSHEPQLSLGLKRSVGLVRNKKISSRKQKTFDYSKQNPDEMNATLNPKSHDKPALSSLKNEQRRASTMQRTKLSLNQASQNRTSKVAEDSSNPKNSTLQSHLSLQASVALQSSQKRQSNKTVTGASFSRQATIKSPLAPFSAQEGMMTKILRQQNFSRKVTIENQQKKRQGSILATAGSQPRKRLSQISDLKKFSKLSFGSKEIDQEHLDQVDDLAEKESFSPIKPKQRLSSVISESSDLKETSSKLSVSMQLSDPKEDCKVIVEVTEQSVEFPSRRTSAKQSQNAKQGSKSPQRASLTKLRLPFSMQNGQHTKQNPTQFAQQEPTKIEEKALSEGIKPEQTPKEKTQKKQSSSSESISVSSHSSFMSKEKEDHNVKQNLSTDNFIPNLDISTKKWVNKQSDHAKSQQKAEEDTVPKENIFDVIYRLKLREPKPKQSTDKSSSSGKSAMSRRSNRSKLSNRSKCSNLSKKSARRIINRKTSQTSLNKHDSKLNKKIEKASVATNNIDQIMNLIKITNPQIKAQEQKKPAVKPNRGLNHKLSDFSAGGRNQKDNLKNMPSASSFANNSSYQLGSKRSMSSAGVMNRKTKAPTIFINQFTFKDIKQKSEEKPADRLVEIEVDSTSSDVQLTEKNSIDLPLTLGSLTIGSYVENITKETQSKPVEKVPFSQRSKAITSRNNCSTVKLLKEVSFKRPTLVTLKKPRPMLVPQMSQPATTVNCHTIRLSLNNSLTKIDPKTSRQHFGRQFMGGRRFGGSTIEDNCISEFQESMIEQKNLNTQPGIFTSSYIDSLPNSGRSSTRRPITTTQSTVKKPEGRIGMSLDFAAMREKLLNTVQSQEQSKAVTLRSSVQGPVTPQQCLSANLDKEKEIVTKLALSQYGNRLSMTDSISYDRTTGEIRTKGEDIESTKPSAKAHIMSYLTQKLNKVRRSRQTYSSANTSRLVSRRNSPLGHLSPMVILNQAVKPR